MLPALFVDKLQVLPLDTDDTIVARSTAPAQVLDQCSLDTLAARVVSPGDQAAADHVAGAARRPQAR